MSRPVSSGKIMEPVAVLQMDNFFWKHPTKKYMSNAHCWWTHLREQLWSGSGELLPVRSFLEMFHRWKRDKCCRDSHAGGMLQRPFISGVADFEKLEMGSATS